jgi:glycosyltransferase involved in cell wall biosynthesis
MKIAYLTQSYPPMVSGAAIFAGKLAESMAQRGHQVLVIAASDCGVPYLIKSDKLTLLCLRSYPNLMRAGQNVALPERRSVLRALREFRPDFIHSHDPFQLGLTGVKYARKARIPIALNIHQLPWFVASYVPNMAGLRGYIESALWNYARWLLQKFTIVITPTQTVTKIIADMTGIKSQSISYGIDLQTIHPHLSPDEETALRIRLGLPTKVPVILHVGRLDIDKRVDRVIRAASRAIQNTDAHLLIVGNGCQKAALMKLCKSMGIEKRSHFPGYISAEEGLPDIYRLANLFVTASEIETQGIVLLEAAASGLPIVAVRATCIPEIVHHGLNGYLTESNDNIALGNAITDLLLHSDEARKMGKTGQQLVQEHNILTTFDSYERLYSNLIKQKVFQRAPEKVKARKWQERAKEWLNL